MSPTQILNSTICKKYNEYLQNVKRVWRQKIFKVIIKKQIIYTSCFFTPASEILLFLQDLQASLLKKS